MNRSRSHRPARRLHALSLCVLLAVACHAAPRGVGTEDRRHVARGGADEATPVPGDCQLGFMRVGMVPQGATPDLEAQSASLEAYLGSQLGARVEIVSYDDYNELVGDVVSGEVDVAQLPPLAFVLARERDPDLPLLATQISRGDVRYSGYLMVRRDSDLQRLRDLENKRVAFVGTSSASGFVFPVARLVQEGVDVRVLLKKAQFLGSHQNAIRAVIDGTVDAAATYRGGLEFARASGYDTRTLRVLGITAAIPQEALVAHSHLPVHHLKCIQRAFLLANKASAAGREALARFPEHDGWTATNEEFYAAVRDQLHAVRATVPEVAP